MSFSYTKLPLLLLWMNVMYMMHPLLLLYFRYMLPEKNLLCLLLLRLLCIYDYLPEKYLSILIITRETANKPLHINYLWWQSIPYYRYWSCWMLIYLKFIFILKCIPFPCLSYMYTLKDSVPLCIVENKIIMVLIVLSLINYIWLTFTPS